MLFNSYIFIFVFLPITLIVFFGLARYRYLKMAKIWLAITSLFFYGYWNPPYLILMILSIVFNHQMGQAIDKAELKSKEAKTLLWIGIIINLLTIGYYKYAEFSLASINGIFRSNLSIPEVILPLAISFYTFTQIAYLVDAYRGETKEYKYDLLTYSLFVTFFPQLIAGPILRHDELIPQFNKLKNFIFSHKNFGYGLVLFSLGLCKKVLIADNVSPWVATAFNNPSELVFIEAWFGALSYTFQLYFDFSGYSDMAIGIGMMFNIKLPINFDSPYKAISISDFWRRWHITLSNFLKDYLYIPLGGSRQGEIKRYTNLLTTMLLGGLWHGAGWTFIVWGGLHGTYLCINHAWRKLKITLPKFVGWGITFIAVVVGWVLFRAENFSDATAMLKTMAGFNGIILPGNAGGRFSFLSNLGIQLQAWGSFDYLPGGSNPKPHLAAIIGLLLGVAFLPNTQEILQKLKPTWWWAIPIGGVTGYCLLCVNRVSEFLYFQF